MKKVNCLGKEIELTTTRIRRIERSIVEFNELIAKEMEYSEDLRNQETINRYHQNVAKLEAMLS